MHHLPMIILNCLFCYWPTMLFYYQKQTQLNSLQRAASSLQLKVNMSKSNIIVFRKGGYLGARERWMYDSVVMPVVNVYKYLGVLFSTKISFTATCCDLSSQAKNAAYVSCKNYEC